MSDKRYIFSMFLTMIITALIVLLAVNFRSSSKKSIRSTTEKPEAASAGGGTAGTGKANPEGVMPSPPKFVIYKQGSAYPVSVVVDEHATDEQVTSLLWLFREKVRSKDFKALGITKPTSVNFGKENWNYGSIVIFKGTECAAEDDAVPDGEDPTKYLGPCGKGDHSAGTYQWGIDGNVDEDMGTVGPASDENGRLVFDYTDGWLPYSALTPRLKAKEQKREMLEEASELEKDSLAKSLQRQANSSGLPDLEIWPLSGTELAISSELFAKSTNRAKFLSHELPKWRNDICKVGFREVKLKYGPLAFLGNRYPIGCP